jgi:hypothetical protein
MSVAQPTWGGRGASARQRRPKNPVAYFVACAVSTGLAIALAPIADRLLGWLGG